MYKTWDFSMAARCGHRQNKCVWCHFYNSRGYDICYYNTLNISSSSPGWRKGMLLRRQAVTHSRSASHSRNFQITLAVLPLKELYIYKQNALKQHFIPFIFDSALRGNPCLQSCSHQCIPTQPISFQNEISCPIWCRPVVESQSLVTMAFKIGQNDTLASEALPTPKLSNYGHSSNRA